MSAPGFHAVCWNCPDGKGDIDLVPGRAANFTIARSGQDQKFQCLRRQVFLFSVKANHEGADGADRKRGLVPRGSSPWSAPPAHARDALATSQGYRHSRRPCALAQPSTSLIRSRTRLAVSVFSAQIGLMTYSTVALSISATCTLSMTG